MKKPAFVGAALDYRVISYRTNNNYILSQFSGLVRRSPQTSFFFFARPSRFTQKPAFVGAALDYRVISYRTNNNYILSQFSGLVRRSPQTSFFFFARPSRFTQKPAFVGAALDFGGRRRRVRDSNPRTSKAGQQFSRLPRSTTPATLLFFKGCKINLFEIINTYF